MQKRGARGLLVLLLCLLLFTGCQNKGNIEYSYKEESENSCGRENDSAEEELRVAFVTDPEGADEIRQYSLVRDGISRFANEHGCSFFVECAKSADEASRESAIVKAVEKGADAIVCCGVLFSDALGKMAEIYPKTTFFIIDSNPFSSASNLCTLYFREEEAGFLAGYAAVYEGYRNLGFYGGSFSSPVGRYGTGFVSGADYAARELGISDDVRVSYKYGHSFSESEELTEEMKEWYSEGVEIIFAAGGSVWVSAADAAQQADGKAIGFDTDMSLERGVFVMSALKRYDEIVYYGLECYFENSCKLPEKMAGRELRCGAHENAVGLSGIGVIGGLSNFSAGDYDKIFEKLKYFEIYIDDSPDENVLPKSDISVWGEE